jgi:hypothetical protein
MNRVERTAGGPITARDRNIIEHVARYRLTTIDALRQTLLRGHSAGAARKIVARLSASDYLHAYPLVHPSRYYVLGTAGARSLGIAMHRTLPLGPQSLPTEFATLAYATLGPHPRKRLQRTEVSARCPWLPPVLAAATHCLDEKQIGLELLRIDLGGPPDHVARKCVQDINRRLQLAEFLPFVRNGKFRLVVITATSEKALALRQAIDRHDWPVELPIHFSIVSDLLALIARKHDA